MYECFNCHKKTVGWVGDYDFSDLGYDGEGIVSIYHCSNCEADIEYAIPFEEELETNEEQNC